MAWSLSEGKIIEDPEGVSWTEAVKRQRAFLANESRVASMYAELDEVTEEYVEVVQEVKPPSSELVRIEIGKEHDSLIASLSDRMEAMTQQQAETQLALVAALQSIGLRDPVVNVEAPNVTVESPITVEQPDITVHTPEVTVQAAAPPNVTVNPEIVLPASDTKSKTVTFVRDFSGRVEGAEITEE